MKRRLSTLLWIVLPLVAAWGVVSLNEAVAQSSGQPVPRMVSIKAAEANIRTGPGVEYPIRWVYRRIDMPVQVIAEFERWRKIRDWEGDEGWVHFALLSARRTAIITAPETTIRRIASSTSPAVARLGQGMVVRVELCSNEWCLVNVQGYDGWIPRLDQWGVEPDESLR